MYTCRCTHTNIHNHTYIKTYRQTDMHAYIYTYIHTDIQTYKYAYGNSHVLLHDVLIEDNELAPCMDEYSWAGD